MDKGELKMKKYTITFAYDIEAENSGDAIDEFLRKMYDSENTTPDSDEFIATEIKID
jgi:hypothetical protein